jgi:TonB family protein
MLGWNEAAWFAFLWSLALKGTAVLCAAYLAAFALRHRSAAARHLVWTAAFAALLALPLLSVSLPSLRIPAAFSQIGASILPDASTLVFRVTTTATAVTASSQDPTEAPGTRAAQPVSRGRKNWPLWLMLCWLGGSLVVFGQMLIAYLGMARQRSSAPNFLDLHALGELPEGVLALETARGSMPMTFGVLQPVVFMPADAAEWSQERRRLVLQHELAHIERGDSATHLMARCALSLLWWHPLAWKAWREFLKERESAADDLVLSAGARASDYASLLLDIARTMQSQNAVAWAGVAMARRSQLEGRLLAILDARVSRKSTRRASALAAAAAAVALCAPIAALRAQAPQTEVAGDVDATIRAAYSQKNHEIVDNAAAAFVSIKNYAVAEKLLDAGLEIRASASGEKSKEYAAGLVKLGDLEASRGKSADAIEFYKKAVALGDTPEVANALIYLGIHTNNKLEMATAVDYFQRAQAVASTPKDSGRALTWLANAESSDPAMESQAEAHFRMAIAQQDPTSADESTSLNLFARFLEQHDRGDEAGDLRARAAAIVKAQVSESQVSSHTTFPQVLRVNASQGVMAPKLLKKVEPEYDEEARAAKYQGTVVLQVVIGPDGLAHNPVVVKSLGLGLDQKAIEAVAQWQFSPGVKDGAPVPVAATVEVNFRLL